MGFVEVIIDRDDRTELEAALRAQQIPIAVRQMTFDSAIDTLKQLPIEQIIRYSVSVGAFAALGRAFQSWLKARSDRKLRVKFRDGKVVDVTAEGYSVDDATKWIEKAATLTLTESGKLTKKRVAP
jgi:hypothetical protein